MQSKKKLSLSKFSNNFESFFDLFGQPVQFNIDGQNKIPSKSGAIMSIILILFFITYSAVRGHQLLNRINTDVTTLDLVNHLNSSDKFDFNSTQFKIAFGVVDQYNYENKDSLEYVEWAVNIEQKIGSNNYTYEKLKIHKCTEQDYQQFYPVVSSQAKQLNLFKEKHTLYCLDNNHNLTLFGNSEMTDYRRLDTKLMPCQPDPSQNKSCTKTMDQMIKYLQSSSLILYHNSARFNQLEFDSEPTNIMYESKIVNKQFDSSKPNFFHGEITRNQLVKESNWNSFGGEEAQYFYTQDFGTQLSSGWADYPEQYRITGFEVMVNFDVKQISLKSFDFLGWLADLGGILILLQFIGMILISSNFAPSNRNSFLVTKLFKQASQKFKENKVQQMIQLFKDKTPPKPHQNFDSLLKNNIQMDLGGRKEIPRWRFMIDFCKCFKNSPEIIRHRILVKKGLNRLEKEMDILQILRQFRILKKAYKATTTGANRKLLEKLSEKVLSSAESVASEISAEEKELRQIELQEQKSIAEKSDPYREIDDDDNFDYLKHCIDSKKDVVSQNLILEWKKTDNARMKRWKNLMVNQNTKDSIRPSKKYYANFNDEFKQILWIQYEQNEKSVTATDKFSFGSKKLQDRQKSLRAQSLKIKGFQSLVHEVSNSSIDFSEFSDDVYSKIDSVRHKELNAGNAHRKWFSGQFSPRSPINEFKLGQEDNIMLRELAKSIKKKTQDNIDKALVNTAIGQARYKAENIQKVLNPDNLQRATSRDDLHFIIESPRETQGKTTARKINQSNPKRSFISDNEE